MVVALTDSGRIVEAKIERAIGTVEATVMKNVRPADLAGFHAVVAAIIDLAPGGAHRA